MNKSFSLYTLQFIIKIVVISTQSLA